MRLGQLPEAQLDALPLWPPLVATRGPGGASDLHAHHAMHIVLAVNGELSIRVRDSAAMTACGVLTAPDVAHALDAQGREVLLVFLDPESEAGASLFSAIDGDVRLISAEERDRLLEGAAPLAIMTTGFGDEWTRRAAQTLGGAELGARKRLHPRVRKALGILRGDLEVTDASLEALARAVELSPGRLIHAFTASIGIPLRPYVQWLKVQRAAGAIVAGMPLAQAAHAAGFADAAHMSRTFRRMFGVTPSALRER
jgi:AraC-like DNA-binding protein